MGTVTTSFTKEVFIDADDFREVDSPDYFRLAPGKSVGLFKAPFPVVCESFTKDPNTGKITEIQCRLENDGNAKKPKAFVQWVNAPDAIKIDEVRYFHPLFKTEPPPADFESDINTSSLEVFTEAVIEPAFYTVASKAIRDAKKESEERTNKAKEAMASNDSAGAKGAEHKEDEPVVEASGLVGPENVRFQGMRLAYFTVDRESKVGCLEDDKVDGKREGDRIILNRIVSLKEDTGKNA